MSQTAIGMWESVLDQIRQDMWRYRKLLPVEHEKNIVSLGEGMTPLLKINSPGV